MNKRTYKGSFTIEAAVIIPLAMALIAALLIFALAVHDGVIMNTVTVATIMENAGKFTEDPENIREDVLKMLQKRLVVAKNISVEVDGTEDQCTAVSQGSFQITSGFIRYFTGEDLSQLNTRVCISNLNGRKMLLKYKTICDSAEHILSDGEEG
ncbi:MAG: hypothetical protein J6S31_02830 [Lachnospiraceae bacterium]|nr:hypothetical protein [Lachnospiraceae bacterium]